MIKYSVTLGSFLHLDSLTSILENLSNLGFQNIELMGKPLDFNWHYFKDILNSYDINVYSVTGDWNNIDHFPKFLLSSKKDIVDYSIQYVKQCIDMCRFFDAKIFNICLFSDPIQIDKNHYLISKYEKNMKLKKSASLLDKLVKYSNDSGISLLLEPLNRYSTPFCTNTSDFLKIISYMKIDNLKILMDTYHMNIEEKSFVDSIRSVEQYLYHIHLADNNRLMPGYGHIDFDSIIKTLKKINYTHNLGFEPIFTSKKYITPLRKGYTFIDSIVNEFFFTL